MSLEESPAPPHSPVVVEEAPEVVADSHPPDDPPPTARRRSSRRSGKSTRRCSELCEEFLPEDDDGEMQRLAALVEEEDAVEAAAAAAAGSSSTLPTPRRSQMKKNRQCSQLVELGDDVLQELHQADHGAEAAQVHLHKVIPRHTHRRSSLLEADPNEISYHPSVLHMYAPPRQRQEWGQRQVLPRVNWGDLFFDLFYVAAAYNASNILVESPSGQGLLYFLACFLGVQDGWNHKMQYDARFVIEDDLFHRLFELLGLCILASTVVHIRPLAILQDAQRIDMFALALSLSLVWVYHCLRQLELYLLGKGQVSVIRASAKRALLNCIVPLACCLAAAFMAGTDHFGIEDNTGGGRRVLLGLGAAAADYPTNTSDASSYPYDDATYKSYDNPNDDMAARNQWIVWLLLCAPVIHYISLFVQVVILFPSDGSHKQFTIPMNVDFCIHRYAEWTHLMLGESLISLLILDVPAENSDYFTTFYCSLLMVIFLQYLHFRSMPHAADDHALRRNKNRGMVWALFKYAYSCALIALGAAVTLFVMSFSYESISDAKEEEEEPSDHFRRILAGGSDGAGKTLQELETLERHAAHLFSASLAVTFFTLDSMAVMNVGFHNGWLRCHCQKTLRYNTKGITLVLLRVGCVVFVATLSQWKTDPESLAGIGLGVTIGQIILRKLGIKYLNKKLEDGATDSSEEGEEPSEEGGDAIHVGPSERNPQLVNTIHVQRTVPEEE